jgi:hypothetical protein
LLVTIVIVVKIGLVSARYGDRVEIPGLAPERLPV